MAVRLEDLRVGRKLTTRNGALTWVVLGKDQSHFTVKILAGPDKEPWDDTPLKFSRDMLEFFAPLSESDDPNGRAW